MSDARVIPIVAESDEPEAAPEEAAASTAQRPKSNPQRKSRSKRESSEGADSATSPLPSDDEQRDNTDSEQLPGSDYERPTWDERVAVFKRAADDGDRFGIGGVQVACERGGVPVACECGFQFPTTHQILGEC